GVQGGKFVGEFLVFGLDSADFIFLAEINLFANAATMLLDDFGDFGGIAVGVVMDEDAHHILRAEFVLRGEFAEVAHGIDEEHLVAAGFGALLAQNEKTGGDACSVKNV